MHIATKQPRVYLALHKGSENLQENWSCELFREYGSSFGARNSVSRFVTKNSGDPDFYCIVGLHSLRRNFCTLSKKLLVLHAKNLQCLYGGQAIFHCDTLTPVPQYLVLTQNRLTRIDVTCICEWKTSAFFLSVWNTHVRFLRDELHFQKFGMMCICVSRTHVEMLNCTVLKTSRDDRGMNHTLLLDRVFL